MGNTLVLQLLLCQQIRIILTPGPPIPSSQPFHRCNFISSKSQHEPFTSSLGSSPRRCLRSLRLILPPDLYAQNSYTVSSCHRNISFRRQVQWWRRHCCRQSSFIWISCTIYRCQASANISPKYWDRLLQSLDIRENYLSSSEHTLNARNLHTYLSKVMYKRRTDFNPLWNMMLVAGLDEDEKPFLASVDLLGTTFSSPTLATGFGAHLAQPLLRRLMPKDEESVKDVTKEMAIDAIKECMKVLFYRDARSLDQYSIAVITKDGVDLKEDEKLEKQSWAFADQIRGYGTQTA